MNPKVLDMKGWMRLALDSTPDDLRKYGPVIGVGIQGISPDQNLGIRLVDVVALVDTGAGHSCISPRLAPKLGVQPQAKATQLAAGAEAQDVPVFHCKLSFPCGIETKANFAVLPHLRVPIDIVVGCDLLQTARLIVDFSSGQWELHFKIPA